MRHQPYFPFYRLGFRANPFRVLTAEEWAEAEVLPDCVEEAWASGKVDLQIPTVAYR